MSDAIKIFSDPSDTNKRVGINAGADPETSDALWVEGDATVNGALTADALSAPSITGGSVFLVNNGSVYIPNALHIRGTHNNNNQLYFDITTDQMGGVIKLSEKTITGGFDVVDRFSFNERSYNSSTGVRNGYYEEYKLPTVKADLTSSITYHILTTKTVITQLFTKQYTLAAGASSSFSISSIVTVPSGYKILGLAGYRTNDYRVNVANLDVLNTGSYAVQLVNSGTVSVTANFELRVIFIPN